MATPVIVKIVLTDGSSQRLILNPGIPESLEELVVEVKNQCKLQGNIKLPFMDYLFGNKFFNFNFRGTGQRYSESD